MSESRDEEKGGNNDDGRAGRKKSKNFPPADRELARKVSQPLVTTYKIFIAISHFHFLPQRQTSVSTSEMQCNLLCVTCVVSNIQNSTVQTRH